MMRRREADEGVGAGDHVHAIEIGRAMFGDDDRRLGARYADGAVRKPWHDARGAVLAFRPQRDDGAPAGRRARAANEIDQAAYARDLPFASELRVDLAEEIDFEARIDRHELFDAREHGMSVRLCHGRKFQPPLLAHALVEAFRAHEDARRNRAGCIENCARVEQRRNAFADQAGKYLQAFLAVQGRDQSVRQTANAALDHVIIVNKIGHAFGDIVNGVMSRRRGGEWLIHVHDDVGGAQ